jgi:hypothetical protein
MEIIFLYNLDYYLNFIEVNTAGAAKRDHFGQRETHSINQMMTLTLNCYAAIHCNRVTCQTLLR